jgi:proline iminopeptidase
MERLRTHLSMERWLLFGGSWGSTLALAYAETHPNQVLALILRGVFTLRASEIAWFYQYGASELFPDAWAEFLAPIPTAERTDLIEAYYRRLTDVDESVRLQAARAWSLWEGATSKLVPTRDHTDGFAGDAFALAFARIECHYFFNRGFFHADSQLLDNIQCLRHLPCVIVQGRYDVVCPMSTAWALHQAWPEAELRIVPNAGHAAFEPGIANALVQASDTFRRL